ncbi:translation initiation factor IF-3 [Aphanothece sacrum]|uniref:Translation initiation factor IF-3 n=1 Tax=Aphanothece sacrum FPU1 TaxID=1920663 RepID=A0A401IIS5_APHSA|nr:translation initiation factor IF-3 [Aphanothece sacrum]GBF81203.1 translation initiation factor 3 [Aphanothece sacrum FPU1]GBF83448.1 translation initiation factor 3 [Aphanothece sacrum FPU3]
MRRSKKKNAPNQLPSSSDKYRINNRIKSPEVRVIGENGEQLGLQSLQEALVLASQAGLDLVEVSPTAVPPVCKIIDYGKLKYQLQKKETQAKKNRTETTVKELKLRYCTDTGDLETKLKHARKFLKDGCKVKFSMRFKGRERAFVTLGREKLEKIVEKLSDVSALDGGSDFSGSQLQILLEPS